MKLPDSLLGCEVEWSNQLDNGIGIVIHDFRGRRVADVMTGQATFNDEVMIESADGVRRTIPAWWIDNFDD